MQRLRAPWPAAIPWVCAVLIVVLPPVTRAADPQPYQVRLVPTGNETLDVALRDSATLISLREAAPVGPFALVQRARQDLARFQAVLWGAGHYQARITITIDGMILTDPDLITRLDSVPAETVLPVAVTVTPGPMFRLGRVVVDGPVPPEVRDSVRLSAGADAVAADIRAEQTRLLTGLRDAGYPLATVTLPPATLHPDAHRLDVTFLADPGPRAPLGAIRINGLERMSAAFVRQRLTLRSGQSYSPAAIEAARTDLLGLGVFSSVRVAPDSTLAEDGSLPVLVDVTERKRHAIDLGASYSTDLGIGMSAAWQHRNLFGSAEQLSFSGAYRFGGSAATRPAYEATARFLKPDFLARDQSLELTTTAVQQSLKAYDQTALIGRATLSRKLTPHWTVGLGVLGVVQQITQEGMRDSYRLLGSPLTARYDSTNSLFDPTRGIRASVSVMPMLSLGSKGGTFVVSQAAGSTYFDLLGDGRSVLAMRGLIGQAAGAGVFGLPPDQRFYAGGSATVRGFRFQSVGPTFPSGRPTGGTAVAAGSLELRQRVYGDFAAVMFVDAGQVNTNGAPFSGGWSVGAGLGVRYHTPIGPIRLDVGVPLNRRAGDDRFGVYIGIGQAF